MLLGEANALANEISAALPDSVSAPLAPTGNPWVDAIAARIREIDAW